MLRAMTLVLAFGIASGVGFQAHAAEPATQPGVQSLPASRGGQDLVGTAMPKLPFDRWIHPDGKPPPDPAGSVTLYRWWTDACPFCAKTLPAIEKLRRDFGPRGLKVVAVYHPKPARDVSDRKITAAAAQIGYDGMIAMDSHWNALRQAWLNTGNRRATSVSFLVDQKGIIRFVHPGVEFFPSGDPAAAQDNADYLRLRNAIDTLLPRKATTAPTAGPLSESDAEEMVGRIPEVGQYLDSVARSSAGQTHGVLFSEGHPPDAPATWQIYVGEDKDDDGAVCWHRFRVDELETVRDENGRWIGIETWRESQQMQNAKQAMQN